VLQRRKQLKDNGKEVFLSLLLEAPEKFKKKEGCE
jgi:hypothetical protein